MTVKKKKEFKKMGKGTFEGDEKLYLSLIHS